MIMALGQLLQGLLGSGALSEAAGGIMGGAGTQGARPGGGITPYSNPFESIGDFDSGHQFEGFGEGTKVADTPSGIAPPTMPPNPGAGYEPGDVSGFANYGMTPPGLPDPTQQITGIMNMATAGNPHQNRKEDPFMQQQSGGLMAYLQALSRS